MISEKLKKEIVEWHTKTFPKATKDGQLAKLEEEILEMKEAKTKSREDFLKELVDVFIVSLVLARRFNSTIGQFIEDTSYICSLDDNFDFLVKEKLEINKKRKWVETGTTYHHED